jgi:hypothetical protein
MAAINLYLANATSDSWRRLSESTQTAATINDGWVVGTGSTNHSAYFVGVERAASTFADTNPPDGSLDTTNFDAFRSENPYTGTFASGNWEFHFVVRSVTSTTGQDGRIRFRLFKADANGGNAVEITGSQQQGSLITDVDSGTDEDSTLTFNPGAFSIDNQYLFVQVAWERTGAATMSTADVNWRTGSSTSAGTRIVTADFTPTRTPPAGGLSLTGLVPTVIMTTFVQPAAAALAAVGLAATVAMATVVTPPAGSLSLTGQVPHASRISIIQRATDTAGPDDNVTPVFGSSAAKGNLLVALIMTRGDPLGNPTGWTTAIDVLNATNNDHLRIAYKVAAGGETAAAFTTPANELSCAAMYEVAVPDPAGIQLALDQATSTAYTTGVTSLSSGTTGTIEVADEIAFAAFGYRQNISSPSLNSGFTLEHNLEVTTVATNELVTGQRILGEVGTYSTTASWTTAADVMGAIATFRQVQNTEVTPPAGGLSLTGLAPTVVVTTVVTPPAGSLALTGHAPTVQVDGGGGGSETTVTPPAGTLALTGAVPTLTTEHRVIPPAGSLALAGAAPTVVTEVRVTPPAGSLALTGAAPTLVTDTLVTPPAGALVLAGATPTPRLEARVTPGGAAAALTGFAPTVQLDSPGNTNVTPPAGTVALAGHAPIVMLEAKVTPSPGSLAAVGQPPTVALATLVTPLAGTLTLTGQVPAPLAEFRIEPPAGSMSLIGAAPTVNLPGTGVSRTVVFPAPSRTTRFASVRPTEFPSVVRTTLFTSPKRGA